MLSFILVEKVSSRMGYCFFHWIFHLYTHVQRPPFGWVQLDIIDEFQTDCAHWNAIPKQDVSVAKQVIIQPSKWPVSVPLSIKNYNNDKIKYVFFCCWDLLQNVSPYLVFLHFNNSTQIYHVNYVPFFFETWFHAIRLWSFDLFLNRIF